MRPWPILVLLAALIGGLASAPARAAPLPVPATAEAAAPAPRDAAGPLALPAPLAPAPSLAASLASPPPLTGTGATTGTGTFGTAITGTGTTRSAAAAVAATATSRSTERTDAASRPDRRPGTRPCGRPRKTLFNRLISLLFRKAVPAHRAPPGRPRAPPVRASERKFDLAENDPTGAAPPASDIRPVSITDEMRRSYLDYAMSVIVSRALPDVRDGLKPVHRRILYSTHRAGHLPGAEIRQVGAHRRRRDR